MNKISGSSYTTVQYITFLPLFHISLTFTNQDWSIEEPVPKRNACTLLVCVHACAYSADVVRLNICSLFNLNVNMGFFFFFFLVFYMFYQIMFPIVENTRLSFLWSQISLNIDYSCCTAMGRGWAS